MQRAQLLWKVVLIGIITLLLMIPVEMIRGLVWERQQTRNGVVADIARGTGHAQRVSGPVIYVPWTRKSVETITHTDDKDRTRTTQREKIERGHVTFLPTALHVDGRIDLQPKHRGIYVAQLYTLNASLKGRFELPAALEAPPGAGTLIWGKPTLVLGIRDTRGIREPVEMLWDGDAHPLAPGSIDTADAPSGIHAELASLFQGGREAKSHDFQFKLALVGTERLDIIPIGESTRVTLASGWPHPSFVGSLLPEAGTQISADGFSAEWRTSHLATGLAQLHLRCIQSEKCDDYNAQTLGVSFIQPVDLYQTVERSAKYGFLFILLTFAAFFLFEVLGRIAIHPIQYGLVGIAVSLFFLLLISLSEHIGFAPAYGIATAACTGLIGYYVGHVLKNRRRGAGFGAALGGLYGALYVILRMEDHALLLGSLLVFACLACAMIATRRVNWYAVSANMGSGAAKPA